MPVCKTCGTQFPSRLKINGRMRILHNRKHCLECMPFKAGRGRAAIKGSGAGTCVLCKNPSKMSKRLCGACTQKIRRHRVKMAGVKMLGGKCVRCGCDRLLVLQFHHVSNDKRFDVCSAANQRWEILEEEIRKCELLCSNCHIEIHSTRTDEAFLEEVERYRGKDLKF